MPRYYDICEHVQNGDTFRTTKQKWIRLARYDAPDEVEPNYAKAKQLLSSLILDKEIIYEPVGESYGRIVAKVWQGVKNINDTMIQSGY
jgi:endonuclease YncB( thermonuclease family)